MEVVVQRVPAAPTARIWVRVQGVRDLGILKRVWIPLLILVVIVAGAFTVSRLRGVFGSEIRPVYADTEREDRPPYDPKQLVYEVFGPAGSVASISYFDVDGDPQYIAHASLPWTMQISMTEATAMANVVAQGEGDRIGCRITVDGEVKDEKVQRGESAFTYCLLRAA